MNFKVFQTIKGLHKKMDPEIMALFIITIGYTCLLGYLATLNSSNLRYIDAFDVDESHAVNLVYEMIKGRSLDPKGFFNYGSLYFYITILFLIPIRLFGHITHTKIVLALRLVETLSAAGSAIVVYLISEKLNVPKWSGVFAAFLLLITQTVLHWSLQAHPDMPQLFFMMLSLYFTLFLLQKKNKKYIILSSLFAGLAFGIKYAGIFIMTGIAAGIFTQEIRLLLNRGNNLKEFFLRLSTKGLLSVCIFLSAFVITNPFILKDFDGFISDVKYESEHVALGHGVYESRDGSKWIEMFGQDNLVGIYVLISYAIYIISELIKTIVNRMRKKQKLVIEILRSIQPEVLIHIFVFAFFGYLFFRVNMRRARFILPLVPPLYIFFSKYISRWIRDLQINKITQYTFPLILFILVYVIYPKCVLSNAFIREYLKRKEDIRVVTGEWLKENYDNESRIWTTKYIYIPPDFPNIVQARLDINKDSMYNSDPDLLLIGRNVLDRFAQEDKVHLVPNSEEYLDNHRTYNEIVNNTLCGFRLVKTFGDDKQIRMFEKQEDEFWRTCIGKSSN